MWDVIFNICAIFNAILASVGALTVGRWLRAKRLARKDYRRHEAIAATAMEALKNEAETQRP